MTMPSERPPSRLRLDTADLPAAWEQHASAWIAWARAPGHDSYWRFHRELFLDLLPTPGRSTLDLGCGEGRLTADLAALGHDVIGVDLSSTMVEAARQAHPTLRFERADAGRLPFAGGGFDLVVAFMSLQDVEDYGSAVQEAARTLAPGGRLCLAIVHPLNSAGRFTDDRFDAPFVIEGSYLTPSRYADSVARGGLEMTFVSEHRPLAAYTKAIADAGLLIEDLREPRMPEHAAASERSQRWARRVPLFLHLRAVKPKPDPL